MKKTSILAVIPGSNDAERLLVVLVQPRSGPSQVSLRQQTWAEKIGWYDQKCIDLEPDQVRQLRGVFGVTASQFKPSPRPELATIPFPGGLQVESA